MPFPASAVNNVKPSFRFCAETFRETASDRQQWQDIHIQILFDELFFKILYIFTVLSCQSLSSGIQVPVQEFPFFIVQPYSAIA